MANLIHSSLGVGHACAATVAMLQGAFVVLTNKGTLFHKRAGYAYIAAMVLVNGAAFITSTAGLARFI